MLLPVHLQQILAVFRGRISKILLTEYFNDALKEILQTMQGSRLTDVEVLVPHVCRASVGQQPDFRIALLNRGVAGSASRIVPEVKTQISTLQSVNDAHKQLPAHPKTPPEQVGVKPRLLCEVVVI